jgi:very-short-patch-repair endonuclease
MRWPIAPRALDRLVAELAERQDGVVARRQLAQLGMSESAIARRLAAGRLHRIHPGAYAVGHTVLTWGGKLRAAVLWGGEGAVVSHLPAACIWDLLSSASPLIHLTVPQRSGASRPGVRVHQARRLHADDCAAVRGVPVTSLARTLLDLAETEPFARLERAVEQAERMRLLDPSAIERVIERNRGRRGIRPLRSVIASLDPKAAETSSRLEREFLRLVRGCGLPTPEVNVSVGPYVVDFLWREQRLIVELDGYEHHQTRTAFERDRSRDIQLKLAGYEVLRITHRRLHTEPAVVAGELRRFLSAS